MRLPVLGWLVVAMGALLVLGCDAPVEEDTSSASDFPTSETPGPVIGGGPSSPDTPSDPQPTSTDGGGGDSGSAEPTPVDPGPETGPDRTPTDPEPDPTDPDPEPTPTDPDPEPTPTEPEPEPEPEPTLPSDQGQEVNQGWIGGACQSSVDCSSADFNQSPSCATSGFPNGYCTQACTQGGSGSWLCPDTDYGASTPWTTTRCITTASDTPTCSAECDFTKSPSGCRPGYGCVLRQRHGQPDKIYPICLPMPEGVWPGEPAKGMDVGDPCYADQDCEHLSCLQLPGGYCSRTMCDHTGCPAGSTCYGFDGGQTFACLQNCVSDGQCRTNEGYECDAYGTCWPGASCTAPSSWDSSVGSGDCANAWSAGLSQCDATPDQYVVVNKQARNLAFCDAGSDLANFHIGLGFSPSGDKKVEGDGKTPEGTFFVSNTLPNSDYYKAFLLSYPDSADAAWGYAQGLITADQKASIENAEAGCGISPQTTALGGYIEIHGFGGGQDWTWGCVAIENVEIDELWGAMGVGDTIVVLP